MRWGANLGGVVCSNCKPQNTALSTLSPATLNALRVLQSEHFHEVVDLDLDHETAMAVEHILREAIHYALDQDVRSAAFLDEVRKRARTDRRAGIQ